MRPMFLALAVAGALLIPSAAVSAKNPSAADMAALKAEFAAYKAESEAKIAALEARLRGLEAAPSAAPAPPAEENRTLGRGSTLELPDISVIGNIVGTYGSDKANENLDKIFLDEGEFAFQGYLYPDLRADVIAAIHRHDGEYATHLEEGYLSFLRTRIKGLSLKVGEKLVDVGKTNARHPHHWAFVDRPLVLESFLGDHGLVGQGVNLSYLFPTRRFLQLDAGAWHVDGHHHEHAAGAAPDPLDPLGFKSDLYSTRLWTSFDLGRDRELEIGASGLRGYGTHVDDHRDELRLAGLDLTYRALGRGYRKLTLQNEFWWLSRKVPVGTLDRFGFYTLADLRLDKWWNVGLRYDAVETPYPDAIAVDRAALSAILTRSLTETTKLRLQYTRDLKRDEDTVYLQALFGIGPHSHPLE